MTADPARARERPEREGPALLQGLAICGVCGQRMTVRYHTRKDRLWPEYICQREGIDTATAICQSIPGLGIDEAIGKLLVETVTPMTLEVALQVQSEIEARADEADALRRQRVERARHEADLARRRFMEADPGNRLVVDVLEAEWNNNKLRALHDAQEELEHRRAQDHPELGEQRRQQILALATDFPRLWNDPKTPQRERKRMVRLLLEDVTLTKGDKIAVGVRFRGGAIQSLTFPLAQPAWQIRQTSAKVVAEIDALLDDYTEGQIAGILNARGRVSGEGLPFHPIRVRRLRRDYALKTRYDRLREAGMLTLDEIADLLGVSTQTVKIWRDRGLLRAHACNDKNECLCEHLGDDRPAKHQGRKLLKRRRFPDVASNRTKGVQCEA
ncbi:MAG: recombinase zinc beta ribbon domain-containing protein [Polyangiaceae bacterium]|nr:recombinase zinc beta ribbon domain-containing protein [Polyangiaceae bacterium]